MTFVSNANVMVTRAPRAHGEPATESNLSPMAHKTCSRALCVLCVRRGSACDAVKCCVHICIIDKCWSRNCAKLAVADLAHRRHRRPFRNESNRRAEQKLRSTAAPAAVTRASSASVMSAHAPCAHGEPAKESNLTPMAQKVCSRVPCVVCLRRSSVMLLSAVGIHAQLTSVDHAVAQRLPS